MDTPVASVQTRAQARRRVSLIWLIPIISIVLAAWLAWHTLSSRGPLITITFESAEGLQAGQSQVKYRDVVVGSVQQIGFSKDLKNVVLTVRMTSEAEPLLNGHTQFWVVKPRVFAGDVQGLNTLISGSYIGMLPGAADGAPARSFVGNENPPVLEANVPGRTFLLRASKLGSLSLGSPVFFRGLDVGTVLGWDLGDMAKNVTIHAFVRAPFDAYVHDESHFWNASGLSVNVGADGVKVQVESLRAIILGGVAFDTPPAALTSPQSSPNQLFPLYDDQDAANSAAYRWRVDLVTYFAGSVAGLTAGAPVTMRGLRVGRVTGVSLEYDAAADRVRVPVHFEIEPERIGRADVERWHNAPAALAAAVARGMRTQLQSSNLLTGAKEVALDVFPDAPPAKIGMEGDVIVLPSVAGGLAGVTETVQRILDKLNALPLSEIGDHLNAALDGVNDLVNGPQLKGAIADLQSTMSSLDTLMQQANKNLGPALQHLPQISAQLDQTLSQASRLVGSMDTGYGGDSKFKRDVDRLLDQLNDTARSVRVLADLLSRHPEALIRGRTDTGTEP